MTVMTFVVPVVILIILVILFLVTGGGDDVKAGKGGGHSPLESSSLGMDMDKLMDEDMKDDELVTKYTEGTGEGIAEVEKLLASEPDNSDLLDWLAFMYYSNNQIDDAIKTYKKVLTLNPQNENQHYYLANSFYKKGMFAEAQKEWEEVIRLKPGSKIAKNSQQRIDAVITKGGGN